MKRSMDFDVLTVSILLLLSVLQSLGEVRELEYEEGSNVTLIFNLAFTEFEILQLKRNNSEIYRRAQGRETGESVSLVRSDVVTFILSAVEIYDSGTYQFFATGLEKPPTYNLRVVSSEKFIGISKNFDNWDPYETDNYVPGTEGSKLILVCRVHGGLRSECFIRWRMEPDFLHPYEQNLTTCNKYSEESLLEIKKVTANLDGTRITCESGDLNTFIFVRTKRKPSITGTYQESVFTEGSKYNVSCVLNDTSEEPILNWLLDDKNITGNATHNRKQIAEGYFEWQSWLTFYPSRQHFAKSLECTISNEEERRSDIRTLTIEFTATISEIFTSPSQFVDTHASVNITCVATGFPQVELYWLKECGGTHCIIPPQEQVYNILSETSFESTLLLLDVNKSDAGSYKCRAYNGVGTLSEEDIIIYVEDQGILAADSINFLENQIVNITCHVTKKEPFTFIQWSLDNKIDLTSNATRYEIQNGRGEKTVLGSTLMFYPTRKYDGSDLTCQWGSHEHSSDTITVNISYTTGRKEALRTFPFTSSVQIIIFVTPACLLLFAICIFVLVCLRRRRMTQRDVSIPKCPDTIGLHALTAINAGTHSLKGESSNVLYEDMTCYTTEVRPSECTGNGSGDEYQLSTYSFSLENDENESRIMTAVVPNCQSPLGDKLWTLFGQDFGIETKQKGNRLSMRLAIEDNTSLPGDEEDNEHQQTRYLTNINNEPDISISLTIHNKLTQHGSIYFCNATVARNHCSMEVTVKFLPEFSHCDEKALFKKELNIVKSLDSHPNIAEVLGVCCASQPNCVILEKISEENLKGVLIRSDENYDLPGITENLRQYAEQVCSGMVFLSKSEYYHPNLCCEKIAVDKRRICKLYDFVPSVIFSSQYNKGQQNRHPIGLMAPEIAEGKQYTCHTEVWGFGVVLLEMYWHGLSDVNDEEKASMYKDQFIHQDSLEKPERFPEDMYDMMLACRCKTPQDRPLFPELLNDIKKMKSKPRRISTTV